MSRLPLVTLYLSERCNSRCTTCDYWRNGRRDLSLASVRQLLPALRRMETEAALLSGGEPLLNREWPQIAAVLKESGLRLWLLTSGLSLAKHSGAVAHLFDAVTVSLDGTCAETYRSIRGLDAYDAVCSGIRALAAAGLAPGLRVTLQRANYRELASFVDLGHALGAREVSFLAVDVANRSAFGRAHAPPSDAALAPADLPELERCIDRLMRDYAHDFDSGFIAESPQKLRRLAGYFSAVRGRSSFQRPRCNAPEFSAVVDASLRVRPCFFINGPQAAQVRPDRPLDGVLEALEMQALRAAIAHGERPECEACVCPLWRSDAEARSGLLPERTAGAA